jgi:hypothetical protein
MMKTKRIILKQNKNKQNTKKRINKPTNITYYTSKFAGTELIPRTTIINKLFNNYNDFLKIKNERLNSNNDVITMSDCFNVENIFNIINTNGGNILLNTTINGNKNFGIDKMITYAFYTKSKELMNDDNIKESIKLIKYQMGKDIHRDNRLINGEDYGTGFFAKYAENYYDCADKFYEIIIGYLHKVSRFVDYNLVNKIALLSCQSMYNFIIDLISHEIMKKILPEAVNITQAEKSQVITLTREKQEVEFLFKSKAYITYNGEIMDITNPCANLDFVLLFDFKNNNYKFTKFIFEYDYDICKTPEGSDFGTSITQHEPEKENNNEKEDNSKNNKIIYGISAGLGAASVAAVPFLLGVLGGNKKNKRNKRNNKKNKTRKRMRSKN